MYLRPKVVILCGGGDLSLADIFAAGLKNCADVKVWTEVYSRPGESMLRTLLDGIKEFDYHVVLLTSEQISPNVLAEVGALFEKVRQRRAFIVCDRSLVGSLPDYLKGTVIATYDGSQIYKQGANVLDDACRSICEQIKARGLANVAGQWWSTYRMTHEKGHPWAPPELIEIVQRGDEVTFVSENSPVGDNYKAEGSLFEGAISGIWLHNETALRHGPFMLELSSCGTRMCGCFFGPGVFKRRQLAGWVLVKKNGMNQAEVSRLLEECKQELERMVIPCNPGQGA